jgi:hypothetical protein
VISCGQLDFPFSSCTSAMSVLRFLRLAWGYICFLWISGGHIDDLFAMRLAQYSSVSANACAAIIQRSNTCIHYIRLRCLFHSSMRENRHQTSKLSVMFHQFRDRLRLCHYHLIEGNNIICNKIMYISHFSSRLICPNPNPACISWVLEQCATRQCDLQYSWF